MRDPLSNKKSPYEILGLDCDTTIQAAKKALIMGIRNKIFSQIEGQRAFIQLKKPIERIFADLMEYDITYEDISDLLNKVPRPDPKSLKEHIKMPEVEMCYLLPFSIQSSQTEIDLGEPPDVKINIPTIKSRMNIEDLKPIPVFRMTSNE
jgi:hypothetical protein